MVLLRQIVGRFLPEALAEFNKNDGSSHETVEA
jgi:hypothetical protein